MITAVLTKTRRMTGAVSQTSSGVVPSLGLRVPIRAADGHVSQTMKILVHVRNGRCMMPPTLSGQSEMSAQRVMCCREECLMRIIRTIVLMISATVLVPTAAFTSTIWTEIGDAGQLLLTAQVPAGSGSLTTINGALSFGDVDIYKIFVTGGGTFSALAQGASPSFLDPELFLFDSQGIGVYANEEIFPPDPFLAPGSAMLPANTSLTPIVPGQYFLAISTPFLDPISSSGSIFPCLGCLPSGVFGPTGPGGASPLIGWSGSPFSAGSYGITLTGAEFVSTTAVPEPSTVLFLGIGLGMLAWRRQYTGRARFTERVQPDEPSAHGRVLE